MMIYDAEAHRTYSQQRYLIKTADDQVGWRHAAIRTNIWTAPPPGVPRLHSDPMEASFWAKKLMEVRTERLFRARAAGIYRGPARSFVAFNEAALLSTSTLEPKVCSAIRTLVLPPGPFFARFTHPQFVESALTRGRFQLKPAAQYNSDPSLNDAQRDEELVHASVRGDRHLNIRVHGRLPGEDPSKTREIPIMYGELFEYMNSKNFYVLCLSSQFDARMFNDFQADAVLIIKEPRIFINRIQTAMCRDGHAVDLRAGAVRYYDPYTVTRSELIPGFSKNFAFTYQQEFRLTWWPKDAAKLSPLFVEIGDMSDIAEALYLQPF